MSSNPLYTSPGWRALRLRTLERDKYRCQIRMDGCLGRATAVDHIVELFEGGPALDPENVQAACKPCNSAKHMARLAAFARPVRQW